jgi:inosine-uridine nucleoside N-ribohydrolase
VTIVQVGFSTNLARLLESVQGRELVRRKVRLLAIMGGAFADGQPEYNIKSDIPAAKKLFAAWPGPIVASGYEIGSAIKYPAASIERDFDFAGNHPVAEAYRIYKPMPYDRETWDLTAVLFAAREARNYFLLSPPGEITVDDKGRTLFQEKPGGKHRYLKLDPRQAPRILKDMIELASSRPRL